MQEALYESASQCSVLQPLFLAWLRADARRAGPGKLGQKRGGGVLACINGFSSCRAAGYAFLLAMPDSHTSYRIVLVDSACVVCYLRLCC